MSTMPSVRKHHASLVFLAALFSAYVPASAAHRVLDLLDRPAGEIVRHVFSTPYGKLNVAEFGKVLRDSADAECLRGAGINPNTLEARGREILMRNGVRIVEAYAKLFDRKKFEAAFTRLAGPKAREELSRLRTHPELRKAAELTDQADVMSVIDAVTESIDRHVLVGDLGLVRRFSALTTANPVLMAENPRDEAHEEVMRLIKRGNRPHAERWRELLDALFDAEREAMDAEKSFGLFPSDLKEPLAEDLRKICVPSRRSR